MTGQQKRPLGYEDTVVGAGNKKYMTDKRYNNWTISGTNNNLRGKSLNYNAKEKMQTIGDNKTNINRLAKGLMSYKL